MALPVCNCQGYGTPSVAQHTPDAAAALATSLPDYQRAVRAGAGSRPASSACSTSPSSSWRARPSACSATASWAARWRSWRARLRHARAARPAARPSARDGRLPLDQLLPQVDALTLHCPLTEQTRHLIGAREIALMKPGAFLVNTARGGLVNEQALADALRAGHLGGAACDVLGVEPPRDGDPLLRPRRAAPDRHPHSA